MLNVFFDEYFCMVIFKFDSCKGTSGVLHQGQEHDLPRKGFVPKRQGTVKLFDATNHIRCSFAVH